MVVKPIKTHKITERDTDINEVLNQYISSLEENSVVAVTSKIISICEGNFMPLSVDKDELIKQESTYYLPRSQSKYEISFTIKNNMLTAGAGIDESNANGVYVMWPKDVQQSANKIRKHLTEKFGVRNIGVIITDSRTSPLRWGVIGTTLAHSGFIALKNYINTPDLFGRPFKFEQLNIADSLAASAVAVMGEGSEQTPLAIISDISLIKFQNRDPSAGELVSLKISLEDDLYSPLLTSVEWKKGKSSS